MGYITDRICLEFPFMCLKFASKSAKFEEVNRSVLVFLSKINSIVESLSFLEKKMLDQNLVLLMLVGLGQTMNPWFKM